MQYENSTQDGNWQTDIPNVKPPVVAGADGCALAPNKLPVPAAAPKEAAAAAEPNVLPEAALDGVPNANICDDGVPSENPPTPVPPVADAVVLGVNWNPPDIMPATATCRTSNNNLSV